MLTEKSKGAILRVLHALGPQYGLDLVRTHKISAHGTIYVLLDRMEDVGLVQSWVPEEEAADAAKVHRTPRRCYRIAEGGLSWLEEHP